MSKGYIVPDVNTFPPPPEPNPAPTPRTDAIIAQAKDYYDRHCEPGDPPFDNCIPSIHDFARTLERELTEARATLLAREGELDSMSAALAAKDREIAELADQLRIVVDAESFRARKIERERDSYKARAEKAEAELTRLDNLRVSAEQYASDFRAERDQLRAEVERLKRRDSFDLQAINKIVADQTVNLRAALAAARAGTANKAQP